jgi:hypothetical protein
MRKNWLTRLGEKRADRRDEWGIGGFSELSHIFLLWKTKKASDYIFLSPILTKLDEGDFSWWADVLDSSLESDRLIDMISSEVRDEGDFVGDNRKGRICKNTKFYN